MLILAVVSISKIFKVIEDASVNVTGVTLVIKFRAIKLLIGY